MNHPVSPSSLRPAPTGPLADGPPANGPPADRLLANGSLANGSLPAEPSPVPRTSSSPCSPDLPGIDLRRVGAHPDHWYPLAWSRELKRGGTLAAAFAGEPIVLVRPKHGPVFALEDRCAHRQVPLSKGAVDGCAVRCCYHGWAYNADGKCTDVPYLGKDRLPNGVRAYPVREKDGLILVFPGDPARADATPLPTLGSNADRAYKTRRFGRSVRCHYSFMHENLMDMNHQFMHSKQMGQMKPRVLGQRTGEDWIEVRYSFKRTGGSQPIGEALIFGERRTGEAHAAERDVMTVRTEYPYQTLRIQTGDEPPVMDLWICYTPLDKEQRTNRVFGLLSVRRPKLPFVLDAAWPLLVLFTEKIFREDRDIVELEQAAHDAQGVDRNQEVFPVIRSLRALLASRGIDLRPHAAPDLARPTVTAPRAAVPDAAVPVPAAAQAAA